MDLATFLGRRRGEWRRLEELLAQVEGSGLASLGDEEAVEFGRLYRRAASDLNQAQTFVRGEETVRYLNDLVARAYLVLSSRSRVDLWGLARYVFWGYPAVFRRNLAPFLLAALLRRFHLPLTLAVADVPLRRLAERRPETADEVYDVLVARDLLHGRAELLRNLERQGVPVIDTVPERLTVDAVNRYLALKTGVRM